MTILKLTKIGNVTAVVMPDDLLARLKLGTGDTLRAEETSNGGLLLTAGKPDRARISTMIDETMDEYDQTFRALAK